MLRRGGVAVIGALACGACGTEALVDDAESGGRLAGDWALVSTESSLYEGPVGAGWSYFMFVKGNELRVAVCDPPPSSLQSACTSDYACESRAYELLGNRLYANGGAITITFEGPNSFTAEAAVQGTRVGNRYRRATALPPAAARCRDGAG